jgi:cytochrome c556
MQQLATAMAGLGQALWVEDYQAMAGHAERIAGHSHIAPAELLRISTTLGADSAGFTEADEAVHEASVRLRDAVIARDRDAILDRLADVQRGCVACHSRFRERLKTTGP